MQVSGIKKLYYSISEVSDITELKQYVLRYWETEFKQLNPTKNRAGNRTYRSADVDLILQIKSLLYDRKYTIKGAKQHLAHKKNNKKTNIDRPKIVKLNSNLDIQIFKEVKSRIDDLITFIENNS